MQKYKSNLQDAQGRALAGGQVTVLNLDGTPAALYADNGSTPLANPVTTNRQGEFEFYAANGRYSIQIAAQGYTGEVDRDVVLTLDPVDFTNEVVTPVAEQATAALSDELASVSPTPGASKVGFKQRGANSVDSDTQTKLQERVSIQDKQGAPDVALSEALALLDQVHIPATTGTLALAPAQAAAVLGQLSLVDAEGPLDILLEAGVYTWNSTSPMVRVGQGQNISLVGADPLLGVIASVDSVTGSAGNFSVTYTTNISGAQPGMALRITDQPGGVEYASATPVRAPLDGEMAVAFYRMGTATTVTGGTTCTVERGALTNLAVGYLVHVAGQTRTVTSVTSDTVFAVDAAWDFGVTGLQWWRYTTPHAGTLSTSGRSTTVTASSGGMLSIANVGDVVVADGVMTKITAIPNDTTLTVNPAVTFGGVPYTIMRASLLHEGTFLITGVVGNQITVRSRSNVRPPVVGVLPGANASVIQTVLRQNGTGAGIAFDRGGVLREMRNIALIGRGSAATGHVGLALNGVGQSYNQGSALMVMGDNTAVMEWGVGVTMSAGCYLFAWKQHITNNLDDGIQAIDGGFAYLREAVVGHNRGIGLLNSGGYCRISLGRFVGNLLQGIRQDVASGMYGDSVFYWGNGSHNLLAVNRAGIQSADGYSMCAGGNGMNMQNGAGGRVSRTLFGCNGQHNISVTGCMEVEATQTWLTGAATGQSGAVVSRGFITLEDASVTGNGAAGVYGLNLAQLAGMRTHITKNGTNGARADAKAIIQLNGGRNLGNVGADVTRQTGGVVFTSINANGTYQLGAAYSSREAIQDDTVFTLTLGNVGIMLDLWCDNAPTVAAILRARVGAGSGGGGISIVAGGGITVLQNTVLTGTTGVDGDITVSVTTDGRLFIENRAGAVRNILYLLKGPIDQ